tara:strand:+ start:171 stop:1478 length:1308 start_codon:yes stop_codon:yes gene_type:complete
MQNSVDIGNIIEEISDSLKEKLINLFNPIINEKKTVESLLLNMPSIQGIIKENEILKEKNRRLEISLQELKKKYKQSFMETSYQESFIVSKNNNNNKNITLEIEEIHNSAINVSKSDKLNIENYYDDNSDSVSDIVLNDMLSNSDYDCRMIEPNKLIEDLEKEKKHYLLQARLNYSRFYKKELDEVSEEDVINSSAGLKTWHDSEISKPDTDTNEDEDEDEDEDEEQKDNSIINEEVLFSLKENTVNPFPPNSPAFNNFNNKEKYPDLEKAPLVWSSFNVYPTDKVKKAYPDLDWSKAEKILNKYKIGQHNFWTTEKEESSDTNEEDTPDNDEEEVEKVEEEEVVEEEEEEEEVEEEEVVEEEEEEEEVEQEEEEEEEELDEEEEEELDEEEEEEEITLVETIINGEVYYTDNTDIYNDDDEIVGKFVNGKAEFS